MNAERVRYLADENIDENIVNGVRRRQPNINFVTANDAGLHSVPDPLVLAYAAQEGRILVSFDKHTIPGHFAAFLASEPEEWIDQLEYLPWS